MINSMSKGQATLLVLLVVAVALGFGLSTIVRSTIEVQMAHQEQEAARAFNAAEAGIEEALKNLSGLTIGESYSLGGFENIEVEYKAEEINYLEGSYAENETAQVNLAGAGAGAMTINWVNKDDAEENPGCEGEDKTPASLLITVIKGPTGGYAIRRFAYNSCNALDNGMDNSASDGDDNYLKKVSLTMAANDELVRIRPVYSTTSLRVEKADLPVQSYLIDSKAQVKPGADEDVFASKAVRVTRTVAATPSIFDYVLFSGTNIVK
jgi:hypothetical protein